MRISEDGIDLIKHFEGCKLTSYPDQGGKWTIGFGHASGDVAPRTTITIEQAEQMLRQDLNVAEAAVIDLLGETTVTQGQFDALVSFVFNLGAKRLRRSTLLKKLKAGDVAGAADEFLRWIYIQGRFIPGLAKRRAEERVLFLAP